MATSLVIGSFMQIASGIGYYYNNKRENPETINWVLVYLPFSVIVFFIFEVYYRMKKDTAKYDLTLKKKYEGQVINESEFEAKIKDGE